MPVSSTSVEEVEMHHPFGRTQDQEAEHALPKLRLVLDDEDAETGAAVAAAAREADRVEAGLSERLVVSERME